MKRIENFRQSFSLLVALFMVLALCEIWHVQEVLATPQGALETPTPGSFQSGRGLIRGWVCTASKVEIEADGKVTVPAVYGEARGDLQGTCGRSDVGFSFQIDWDANLGEGVHTIRALADGVEFARATFSVVVLGQTKQLDTTPGEFVLNGFPQPGQQTQLHWDQTQHRFFLSNGGTPSTGGSSPQANAKLEDPTPGSFQSGIGVIRGWVCTASKVEIEADGKVTVPAVYGEARGDLQGRCGRSDVGFSFQINWADLGDGPHTVRALADGVEFARSTFTVVTLGLGDHFVRGLDQTTRFDLSADFPEKGLRPQVHWDESLQNLVPTGVPSVAVPGVCGSKSGSLSDATGTSASLLAENSCTQSGNQLPGRVQTRQGAAHTELGNARAQSDTSSGGFFLCGKDLSIQQGGQLFDASNFRLLDLMGNEVCESLAPDSSLNVIVVVNANSNLNFNAPFTLVYNQQPVVDFAPAAGVPVASVSGIPSMLAFDTVAVGSSQDKTFTLTNAGPGTLNGGMTVNAAGSGGQVFSLISPAAFLLEAGQSQAVTVRFQPTDAVAFTGSVRLSSNGGAAAILLSGAGKSSGPVIPSATLSIAPTNLDFGSVQTGQISDQSFTVTNSGGGTLTGSVTVAAPFSIISGDSFNLGAGQNQIVTVRYSPVGAGADSGSVTISSNGGSATVAVSGRGQTPAPGPQLSGVPSSLDFGTVAVGQTGDQSFTVTNSGGGTLMGSVSTAAPFSIVSGGSFSLGAEQSQTVTVRFSPTGGGTFPGSVTVSSNGSSATVTVSGSGQPPVPGPQLSGVPASLDFGPVMLGGFGDQSFTVTNSGGGTLTGSVSTAAPFSIVSGGSFSLGAGQSQTITDRYTPTATGPASGSIAVSSNGGSATVTVSGSGQPPAPGPQLSVSPTTFAFGSVPIGSNSASQSFTITNSGGGTLTGTIEYTRSSPTPFSLQQGQSGTFFVFAIPDGPPGPFDIPLLITSNGGDVTLHLTGTAFDATPSLSFSPMMLDFGFVNCSSRDQTFTITNSGGGMLTGTVSLTSGSYIGYGIVSGTSYNLSAMQSQSFTVRLTGAFGQPAAFPANGTVDLGVSGASIQLTGSADCFS